MIRHSLFSLTVLAISALGWANTAHAGLGACGDIHVEANAQCEVKGGIECEAQCTPISFQAQCAAELTAQCGGQCNAEIDVDCSASCMADCSGQCEVNPGQFDCKGECYGECTGSCDASCSSAQNKAECQASCEGTCEGHCSARCDVTPPSADCNAKCEASCGGRCEGEANIDCQVMCQASGFVQCEADLEGGCKGECNVEQGALFCDGQYVDHGGNLEECVDSLRALLNIEVSGYAEGMCSNGMCSGEAGGSISCAVEPSDAGRNTALLGAFGLMVVGFAARRRRAS